MSYLSKPVHMRAGLTSLKLLHISFLTKGVAVAVRATMGTCLWKMKTVWLIAPLIKNYYYHQNRPKLPPPYTFILHRHIHSQSPTLSSSYSQSSQPDSLTMTTNITRIICHRYQNHSPSSPNSFPINIRFITIITRFTELHHKIYLQSLLSPESFTIITDSFTAIIRFLYDHNQIHLRSSPGSSTIITRFIYDHHQIHYHQHHYRYHHYQIQWISLEDLSIIIITCIIYYHHSFIYDHHQIHLRSSPDSFTIITRFIYDHHQIIYDHYQIHHHQHHYRYYHYQIHWISSPDLSTIIITSIIRYHHQIHLQSSSDSFKIITRFIYDHH